MAHSAKEPLSNERIVQAALEILDSDGVVGLSMRRLGKALNVEAASLYYHIPNKGVLIQKIIDTVSAKAVVAEGETLRPWTEVYHTFASNFREILRTHPGVAPLVAVNSVSDETSARLAVPLVATMSGTSASIEQVLIVIQSISVFVIGHALAEVGNWPDPPTAPRSYYDQWFEAGITALINGFKQQFQDV